MPYLTLKLDKLYARLEVGEGAEANWRLRWRTAFADPFETLHLSNGKDLRELPGALFLSSANGRAKADEAIGTIHFIEAYAGSTDGVVRPSPDEYSVELALPPAIIRDLFGMEQQGKGPCEATISIPDLTYGALPDGSAKHWEIEDGRNWLAVNSIIFAFPCQNSEEDTDYEIEPELEIEPRIDPTVHAIQELARKVDVLTGKLGRVATWLIFGGAAILIAASMR